LFNGLGNFWPRTENPRVGGSIPSLATISTFPDYDPPPSRTPEYV
jgi:hypothetical protein